MSFLCLLFLGLCSLSFVCYFEMTTPGLVPENIQQQFGLVQPALALTYVEPSAPATAALTEIEEKEVSSDGSFSKVSAIKVSDDSSSSEHSYLFLKRVLLRLKYPEHEWLYTLGCLAHFWLAF